MKDREVLYMFKKFVTDRIMLVLGMTMMYMAGIITMTEGLIKGLMLFVVFMIFMPIIMKGGSKEY